MRDVKDVDILQNINLGHQKDIEDKDKTIESKDNQIRQLNESIKIIDSQLKQAIKDVDILQNINLGHQKSTGMVAYYSKNPFTKMLFWKRILTAIAFAKIIDDSVLLDIGCNTGHLLKTIRKFNTRCECYGIDVEPKKIMTREIAKFQVADARRLPFIDHSFNIVFVLDTLEHIEDVDSAIKEIHRVLMPNGIAILSGPTESWFYKFCRFLQFGQFILPSHFHTVYELEEKFIVHGFILLEQKSLPSMPLPTLFSVSKFQRHSCDIL